ncbi:hypothetical protein XENOCAPTIV_003091 [Xenoophorus captivus]|uniref:Uncharacterized protein n=1 Tax=Xenoophorus captivus TaxID=1517983 RepID=A0ABV0SE51_9TELE
MFLSTRNTHTGERERERVCVCAKNESEKTACGSSVKIPLTLLSLLCRACSRLCVEDSDKRRSEPAAVLHFEEMAREIGLNRNRRGKAVAKHTQREELITISVNINIKNEKKAEFVSPHSRDTSLQAARWR